VKSYRPFIDREFTNQQEALAFAETLDNAELIEWAIHPNLPGALPKEVYQSCALDMWNGTDWKTVNIF
ncbi:hypothetical protein LCGC14_2447770, partial [marine sediment metagenome]